MTHKQCPHPHCLKMIPNSSFERHRTVCAKHPGVDRLRTLYAQNTTKQIAPILGVSHDTVCKWLRAARIPMRRRGGKRVVVRRKPIYERSKEYLLRNPGVYHASDLVYRFEVSRSTVGIALRRLVADGLVENTKDGWAVLVDKPAVTVWDELGWPDLDDWLEWTRRESEHINYKEVEG